MVCLLVGRRLILNRFSRIRAVLAVVAFLLIPAFRSGARETRMEVVPPASAWNQFLQGWESFRAHLEKDEPEAARKDLQAVVNAKWDGALGDLPVQAVALLRWAQRIKGRGDPETAKWLAESAPKLAPDSFRVQLCLARYYLGGGPVEIRESLSHYLKAVDVLRDDFPAIYRLAAQVVIYPVVFLGIFGAAFGLICVFRYSTLLVHDCSDLFPPDKLPQSMLRGMVALVLLLPLAAGFSFWWLLSWWFAILSLYMNRGERVLVYLWFILLLLTPWLLEKYSVFAGTRSDPVLASVLRVRNGVPDTQDLDTLEQALNKKPDDLLVRFSLAQLLQREGRFNKAVSIYGPLLNDKRTSQAAYNNIAEIYLWDGSMDTVFRALSAAAESGGPRAEVSFNLGQYFQETEQLLRMDEEYKAARSINSRKVDRLIERAQEWKLNRYMAPIPVPWDMVWERSTRGSPMTPAAFTGIWNQWMGRPSGLIFMASVIAMMAATFLLQIMAKRWQLSYRCSSCGRPICHFCQKPPKEPGICTHCYNVFRGEGGVELQIKMQKRSEVQRYRDIWGRAGLLASLLFPGSGQALLGFSGMGVPLLALSALIWAGVLSAHLMWPDSGPGYRGGVALHGVVLVFVYLILMIVSVLAFRSRADHWR